MASGFPAALRDEPYPGPFRVLGAARACPCMTTGEFAVLTILVLTADNETGLCDPAMATLAEGAKMSDRGTRNAVAGLEAGGWLSIWRRKVPGRKENDTHVFSLRAHRHVVDGCARCAAISAARPAVTSEGPAVSAARVRQSVPEGPAVSAEDLLALPRLPDQQIPLGPPAGGTNGGTSEVGPLVTEAAPAAPVFALVATDSAKPAKAPRARKAPAGPMPSGWAPSPVHVAKGLELGFDPARVQAEATRFTDHHTAKGNVFASWDAAFRTWLGNESKWATERANARASPRGRSAPAPHAPSAFTVEHARRQGICPDEPLTEDHLPPELRSQS